MSLGSNRTPNAEQMTAIQHHGGKILSAGAGSGKTFVIIEHIVTLLEKYRTEIGKDDWQNKIPFLMPRIVLMTFTKKAAGEMSIRLMNRIDSLCESSIDDNEKIFWSIVRKYLSSLNVTTISSFCHSLISQGHMPSIGTKIDIVSRVEYKEKITRLFNNWFISRENNLSDVFQANPSALISAMINIFTSPELRIIWSEPVVKSTPELELKDFVENIYTSFNEQEMLDGIDIDCDEKEKTKGWFVFLSAFSKCISDYGPLSTSNIKHYFNFAGNAGRLPSITKAMSVEQKIILDQAKSLISYLRSVEEDLVNLIDNYDVYWSWVETFKDLFDYIDHNYLNEKGFDYSDLEFYVCKGLGEELIRNKVCSQYDTFIVDEFQDTSSVQYQILQYLVGQSKNRLFCVGDRKQAIYGFRGGELLVFSQCASFLGKENTMMLRNNFRSHGKIIDFNNDFFEAIFPLGNGFEGHDVHSVTMEAQIVPEHNLNRGIVQRVQTTVLNVENEKKINVDFFEAKALTLQILELLKNEDIESICVLYRKLKPSFYLIENLTQADQSFTAQIKIEYGEDPVINLFLRFVETILNKNDSRKLESTLFLIDTLFEVIGLSAESKSAADYFQNDVSIIGLRLAFHKLAFSLGINNSLYQENSQLIDSICKVCKDAPAAVYQMLNSENSQQYSLELTKGARSKRIVLMSSHASKGLEFDAVLIGGIHSNGNQMGKTETIGKLPKSFRWKKVFNQKQFFKSPAYYIESAIEKAKEFSESKRLLYVACTRAVKFLGWVDLECEKDGKIIPLGTGANHWVNAFRNYANREFVLTSESKLENEVLSSIQSPMLLTDELGISIKAEKSRIGIMAETSVTKLAQLAQCPFKFYLSTICKLTPPNQSVFLTDDDEELQQEETFFSSKVRGIAVHEDLASLLTGRMLISEINTSDKTKYEWVMVQAEKYKNYSVISEKLIKFSFFGQMISGTPDLVFDNDHNITVWDFKTGTRDELAEEHYWFQIMCYGYAYANLKQFTPEKKVALSLLYIDQKIHIERQYSLEEMTEYLFGKWVMTESLHQVNYHHCPACEYSPLCHKKATSSS